jgi:hypothetical protein
VQLFADFRISPAGLAGNDRQASPQRLHRDILRDADGEAILVAGLGQELPRVGLDGVSSSF